MSPLGKQIRLSGKTLKGKNRIKEHGEFWHVLAVTDHVLFSPNNQGPWLFVAPLGKTQDDKASRWIHGENDINFNLFTSG